MLSKLLPVILLILGTAGGIGAGIMLAPPAGEDPGAAPAAGQETHPAPAAKAASRPEDPANAREFVKLASQFVIPVVERDQLSSLVVISLSLEAKKGMTETIHAYEPKLRDVFLQVLFDHANMGGFRGAFTRSDVLTPLRTALREAAQQEIGRDIYDVLIMEITRQDV